MHFIFIRCYTYTLWLLDITQIYTLYYCQFPIVWFSFCVKGTCYLWTDRIQTIQSNFPGDLEKKHLSPSLSESNSKSPWKLAGWEVCFPFSVWFLNDVDVHLSLHPAKTCANTRSVNWFHLSFEFRTPADFEVKLLLSRELFFLQRSSKSGNGQRVVWSGWWFGILGMPRFESQSQNYFRGSNRNPKPPGPKPSIYH